MEKPVNEKDLYTYCPQCRSNLALKTIDKAQVKSCNKCGFVFWNNPKPAVSILLYRNGDVLMIQRAHEPFKNYWVLPGGFIGHEETAEEAIKREAKEEIGLGVLIDGLIGVYRIDNDPRGIHIDIIFHGRASDQDTLNKEDKKWQYFSPENLPENVAYKHRNAITDWHTKGNQYG